MNSLQERCKSLADWLQSSIPGGQVNLSEDFERDVHLFRVNLKGVAPSPVLRVGEQVLEDIPTHRLIAALEEEDVAARLVAEPNFQISVLAHRGILPVEELVTRCEGRGYRIIRQRDGVVKIFDSDDNLLERLPPRLVKPRSIHMKDGRDWCEEILEWRGSTQ